MARRIFIPASRQRGLALITAMLVSFVVLILADRIRRLLGDSVVSAIEKLMGPSSADGPTAAGDARAGKGCSAA